MSLNSFSEGTTGACDRHAASSFSSLLISACRTTFSGIKRRRQFRHDVLHVRDLPDHLLQDIGIQRGNIVAAVYGGRGRA